MFLASEEVELIFDAGRVNGLQLPKPCSQRSLCR